MKGKQQGGPAAAQGKLAVISRALEIGQLLTSPALSSHQGEDSKTGVRDFKSSDPTALKISFASYEEVVMLPFAFLMPGAMSLIIWPNIASISLGILCSV